MGLFRQEGAGRDERRDQICRVEVQPPFHASYADRDEEATSLAAWGHVILADTAERLESESR